MIEDAVSIAGFVVGAFGLYYLWLTRRSGERRPADRRDALRGTGPADAGPRLYKDVARDHRGHGDEDPPQYMGVQQPYGLGDAREPTLFKKKFSIAKPEKQQPRRDGIRLSDEANAELLKDIFGEEGPQC